jgi:hypothetical protein
VQLVHPLIGLDTGWDYCGSLFGQHVLDHTREGGVIVSASRGLLHAPSEEVYWFGSTTDELHPRDSVATQSFPRYYLDNRARG